LFRTVQEGSIVLVARGYSGGGLLRAAKKQQYVFAGASQLISRLEKSLPDQNTSKSLVRIAPASPPTKNATRLLTSGHTAVRKAAGQHLLVKDVLEIRLGGVTGDASFFLLSDAERSSLALPTKACRPILSKASHLMGAEIADEDWQRLRSDRDRVWLFDPSASQLAHPAIKKYMKLASSKGGCNRKAYKVRVRDPWYRTPIQREIHGFMSGMSGWGPWVVFKRMPRLAASNTLYLVRFKSAMTPDEQAAWAMWLLTTRASRRLRSIGRRYADGLLKFEPGDIASLRIDEPKQTEGAQESYSHAVQLLLTGQRAAARRVADKWFD